MKLAIFLLTALIIACTKAQSNDTFLPIAIAHEGTEYVAFGSYLYAFSLPDLNTLRQQNYSQSIISFPPISVSNETLYLGDGIDGSFEVNLASFELSQNPGRVVEGQTISGSLMTLQNEYCVTDSANTTKFCFVGGSPATITKTDANGNNTIELGNYTVTRFMKVDEAAGVLHLTAEYVYGRGGDNAVYWTFPLQGDFQIQTGPLTLNNTFISGCPVAPRGCGVPILLYQDVYNGTLVYLWTIARSGDNSSTFEVHLVTVNNETFTEIFFDDSTYTPTFVTEVESTDSSESSGSESSDVSQSSEDASDSSVASDSGSDIASSDSVTPSESSPVEKKRFRS